VSKTSSHDGLGKAPSTERAESRYRYYFWLLAGVWTVAVGGSLAWNLIRHAQETRALTAEAARTLLEKDLLYREWSLMHGGVYVPTSSPARPGDYPQKEEREILTPSGVTLTLLNPAVASREIFEIQAQQMGIRGHITSLRPLRQANAPDTWERQALSAFESGGTEISAIESQQGQRYFRMMRPLVTNPSCLRCHEEQDRKVGEIRGGISVTVPMSRFANPGENARLAVAHFGLWVVGLAGLFFGAADLDRHFQARRRAENERERLIAELQKAMANVKTLTGLIPICASCKKVRTDEGYWTQLETFLEQHSHAEFSHGLCVDCMRKLYPDIAAQVEARLGKPG
jgi:hypothetical protein